MMVEQHVTVRFVTPAFLGDAEQKGAWRTPPFKALLRQWWRIVAARRCEYDYRRLREEEGRLFGHAWLKDEENRTWALQSRVRLRLGDWAGGHLMTWGIRDPQVRHREVERADGLVGAHLYLGYGPLSFERGVGTKLKVPPAIGAGAGATLALAYPEMLRDDLTATLQLIAWFGTVGGRSRNGWGSLELAVEGLKGAEGLRGNEPLLTQASRPLLDCLSLDWPHALGRDDRGLLVWRTKKPEKWNETMKRLAEVKIAFRTQFRFDQGRDAARPVFQDRHLLAYPVTNHGVLEWSKLRLANQLRFKVVEDSGGCVGIVAHVPSRLPDSLGSKLGSRRPDVNRQVQVWKKVHEILDGRPDLQRL